MSLLPLSSTHEFMAIPPPSTLKSFSKKRQCYGIVTSLTHPRLTYPKAVAFVLIMKLLEAFAANGMRTILALYLRDNLFLSESVATIVLHVFNFFGQFCPLFGAILADSYIGNVRAISSTYFLYGFGWMLMIGTSSPYMGNAPIISMAISLLLIAIGNGSSRACVTTLGATQYQIPQQIKQLSGYFTLYYFVYYSGIFLSKILPPMIRANIKCFDKKDCYPAVFGTLGLSFFVAWFVFCLGKFYYKSEKLSDENVVMRFCGCVKVALVKKCSRHEGMVRPKYWLHYALGSYPHHFINDVDKVLKLAKLFLPLPIYFALLTQQDSSWTYQASLMNTTLDAGISIQPDQAKAMGPIFLFMLIPLWQYLLSPSLALLFKYELKPLKSVALGAMCSSLAFICAGSLQRYIYTQASKSVSILWQVPQFVLLMMGELFLSIPGLQFSFIQAPASMKSIVTAIWGLNNAFGNLIVVTVKELNLFATQSDEFYFYGIVMFLAVLVYITLANDFEGRLTQYTSRDEINTLSLNDSSALVRVMEDRPSSSYNYI